MRRAAPILSFAIALLAPGVALGQLGLSQQSAGLGLKPALLSQSNWASDGEAMLSWQGKNPPEIWLYGGTRESQQSGLRAAESYVGFARALTAGSAVSFEAGYVPETLLAPRRYALTGNLHTALSDGQVLSVGLKYRFYDSDSAQRNGIGSDAVIGTGYTLAPYRVPGTTLAPSYQLQFSYQYSAASTFGMVVGRDLETFTPYLDVPAGGPRQLSFTGRYSLTPSWALSYDLLSQDATSPLRVQGLRLGVRYRF